MIVQHGSVRTVPFADANVSADFSVTTTEPQRNRAGPILGLYGAIGPFEMTEYLGLAMVYGALIVTVPFVAVSAWMPRTRQS